MERINVKRAIEIDKTLSILEKAIDDAPLLEQAEKDKYWSYVTKHQDGSGWKMDLTGANIAHKIVAAVLAVIEEEKELLLMELASLK